MESPAPDLNSSSRPNSSVKTWHAKWPNSFYAETHLSYKVTKF